MFMVVIYIYQVRVEVADGGNPARTRTAILTVNIQRNLATPIFAQTNYKTEILEIQTIGQSILKVQARDADQKVRCYGR